MTEPTQSHAASISVRASLLAALPKHCHLKLDYGLPTERIVSFATQAERLEAAKAALRAERRKP